MKKFLLLAVVAVSAAFLFGCASDQPATETDPAADINKALAAYEGACADIAFADTRAKMKEVDQYKANNQSAEANKAYAEAKDLFDKGLANFTDMTNSADKSTAAMNDQKSRMDAIKADADKYAKKEYADTKKRVDAAHASAAKSLSICDVKAAEATLAKSEKDIAALEQIVATRMNGKAQPVAGETYTVKKGDCLWKIAASKYSNPYFWPLIYWSNKGSIKDPDLIYPNQQLKIETNYDDQKKADAQKMAKTRGAWSLYDGK